MINHQQSAMVVKGKGSDLQFGPGQFFLPAQPRAVMACAPDFPGRVVAINIDAIEFGKLFAVVNHPTGEGARFGMGMLDGWRHDGRRTELAVEVEGMASCLN